MKNSDGGDEAVKNELRKILAKLNDKKEIFDI